MASSATIIAFLIGTAINTWVMAYGARSLLDARFPLVRTLVAGAVGQAVASPIISALIGDLRADREPAALTWLACLGFACALLVSMTILVLWEAFVPTGTVPSPLHWYGGVRSRIARTRRYRRISFIFLRHGLGPYLRGRARPSARTARSFAHALEQGGVVFVKLGQVLSTRRDVLPPEFVQELGRLQDCATPVPWPQIERVLHEELGDTRDVFAAFDRTPLAAASIAQVHRATLRSGEEVVVKIQRPGVGAVVERDLDIVGRLARTLHERAGWARSFGVVDLADGFATALREELDFRVEARNMASVAATARNGDVVVPRPHDGLCTSRVLVMQRLDGVALGKAGPRVDSAGLDRTALARTLLDTVLRQIVVDGVFHADPHPGNILLLDDGRLGLIDFGSVGRLDTELRGCLQRMLIALNRGDAVAVTDAFLEVVARPDELDEQALARALGAFMTRHLGPGTNPDMAMFTDLFRLVARFELAVPAEIAAVFRALATLEGGLSELAPGFAIVTEAHTFGESYLRERLQPASLREAANDELLNLLPMLRRLPRRLDRITAAAEAGRLGLNVRLFADESDRRTVTGLLQQVLLTILASTAGVMAVMLLGLRDGPAMTRDVTLFQFFGYCGLVICSVLSLRVLTVIFRR
ncbi:ubiquinone biosynthesis protein [Actinomadura coerulea]|uniref:Ubiquinone biosynthesis protein n=1 Tax=Actinomadura coerulea TaxID=46159 RepID=A0A7X0G6N9_9ACTN|nr:AarF/UbiB family protein [Actinomadura coerulea]MBB6399266.1 ubiquinone biosynthesis protein [Actinomadura coerulea]GGQ27771.1 ubiquinone biosynthesis protein UbiB [Actinomadura coerulea]